MIDAIVFSKDRACQLHLLLESIVRNAPGVYDVTVAYDYSDRSFGDGYELLSEEQIALDVRWVRQQGHGTPDFKEFVTWLLEWQVKEHTCFFCDDDVIFRPIEPGFEEQVRDDVLCFTPRYGLNITWNYGHRCSSDAPDYEDLGEFIRWNWPGGVLGWGYPMSLDGHVFRTDVLREVVDRGEFPTVNLLETAMHRARLKYTGKFPLMMAWKQSALVSIPANRVQTDHGNRYDEDGPTTVELNDAYLAGQAIDLDAMDFSGVRSVAAEIPFPMKEM